MPSKADNNERFWKIVGLAVTLGIVIAGGLVTYGVLRSDVEHLEAVQKEKVDQNVYDQKMLSVQADIADTRRDVKENQKAIIINQNETTKSLGAIGGDIKVLKSMVRQVLRKNGEQ